MNSIRRLVVCKWFSVDPYLTPYTKLSSQIQLERTNKYNLEENSKYPPNLWWREDCIIYKTDRGNHKILKNRFDYLKIKIFGMLKSRIRKQPIELFQFWIKINISDKVHLQIKERINKYQNNM